VRQRATTGDTGARVCRQLSIHPPPTLGGLSSRTLPRGRTVRRRGRSCCSPLSARPPLAPTAGPHRSPLPLAPTARPRPAFPGILPSPLASGGMHPPPPCNVLDPAQQMRFCLSSPPRPPNAASAVCLLLFFAHHMTHLVHSCSL